MDQGSYKTYNCNAKDLFKESRGHALGEMTPSLILTDPPYCTNKRQLRKGGASYLDTSTPAHIAGIIGLVVDRFMGLKTTLAVICDYRLAYTLVTYLEKRLGLTLRGEIIWEFGLGRARTSWWPNRHNHILTFTASDKDGMYNPNALPRTKRLAKSKGYPDDKPMGSVWEFTFSNTHRERVKYPNQKPSDLLIPLILAHSKPGDLIIDPFMGSGSTGVSALMTHRKFMGCDLNPEAIDISEQRLRNTFWANWPARPEDSFWEDK